MTRTISIIFNDDHIESLNLSVDKIPLQNITTKWLRRNIRSLRSQSCQFRSLRFLRNGSLLIPSKLTNQLQKYWESHNNTNTDSNSNNVNEMIEPFYIHCNIGIEDITNLSELEQIDQDFDHNAESNNGDNNLINNDMGAIGFDRLRNLGFNDEEIELLRQQFRNTYGQRFINSDDNNDNDNNEIDISNNMNSNNSDNSNNSNNNIDTSNSNSNTDVRQLEEQWMENDINDETFNSIPITNLEHNKDLFVGISIGFTLGIFSLLLLKLDGLFNNRQKMSIYAGILINIFFCLINIF